MSLDELDHMKRYLVEEEAEHLDEGSISRREFIRRVTMLVGGAIAAGPILMAYGCSAEEATATVAPTSTTAPATAVPPTASPTAAAATSPTAASRSAFHVAENDPAISASSAEFPGSDGATLMGYMVRPAGAGETLAGVLVIHENKGLTEHIKDVVRRVAKAGYVALGVDLLSRNGGTASIADEGQRSALLAKNPAQNLADLTAGLDFLGESEGVDKARLGAVGFCFGGGMTWQVATHRPDLKAAVPYYGPNPPLTEVPNIEAAVLGIYGGNDARITNRVPELEEALKAANITYQIEIFDGAGHAFNNDTGTNYRPNDADAAWAMTLEWFGMYLT